MSISFYIPIPLIHQINKKKDNRVNFYQRKLYKMDR